MTTAAANTIILERTLGQEFIRFLFKAAWKIFKWSAFLFVLISIPICLMLGAIQYWDTGTAWVNTKYEKLAASLVKIEVVREFVPINAVPLEERMTELAAKNRIPLIAARVIVYKESSNGKAKYHFEPGKYAELKQKKAYAKLSDDEIRMMASSHGEAHVMGYTAKEVCNMHWSDLYDQYNGMDCGFKVFRQALDSNKHIKDIGERFWAAFKAYNGSGAAAEAYANHAMIVLVNLVLTDMKKELD